MDQLLPYWFSNEKVWFGATPDDDKLITEKFGHLLSDNPNIKSIKEHCNRDELLQNILLYDQIIRHVYRGNKEKIKELSRFSLELSLYVLDLNLDKQYLPQERVFILMPLRHTFELDYLRIALDKIKEYRSENDCNYYVRFYKATILSKSDIETHLVVPENINDSITNDEIFNALDPNCVKNLEVISEINKSEPIYNAFRDTINKMKDVKAVTLSLSGGVDSMISSFNLYHLSNKQQKFKIIAVTVDYGNREDNKYEVEFVKRWCRLLGITHYVRHITDLKRNRSQDRDLYEKMTRKMRFDMYRRFNNPVILGHNLGDCLENVFNNIKKTRSLNNLRGMGEFSEEEGCQIVRPMLDISKDCIRAFARKYMVPHLPNSTPSWSERGKIRDELIPFINKFDQAIIPGMINLADNMKQLYDIYNISVVERFYNSIDMNEYRVLIDLPENAPEKKFGFVFWKDIVCRILRKLDLSYPSNKAIESFSDRISYNQYGMIKLTKTIGFKYTNTNIVLQLKEEPNIPIIKNNKIKKVDYDNHDIIFNPLYIILICGVMIGLFFYLE
jgi:tRNA(Ile)-lysidine synthetase-like protein